MLPKHVGIIMDGNRRWAKKHFLPSSSGHKKGVENLEKIIKCYKNKGVKILTIYAFSTENWKRQKEEVDNLMNIFYIEINNFLKKFNNENIRINFIGDRSVLNSKIIENMKKAEDMTKNKNEFILNVAINYGAKSEILRAFKENFNEIINKLDNNENNDKTNVQFLINEMNKIQEEDITKKLYVPEADLLILTADRHRLSNFLLWQSSYAELFITTKLWPEFSEKEVEESLNFFDNTKRNFGV